MDSGRGTTRQGTVNVTKADLEQLMRQKPPIKEPEIKPVHFPNIARRMAELESLTPEQRALNLERDRRLVEERERQEHQAATSKLAAKLGRRYSPDRVSLDAYQVYHEAQREVIRRLKAILPDLPAFVQEGRGLIFYGSVGSGKDHLLAAALYAAAGQGVSCTWANGMEIYGDFRDCIDSGNSEDSILREYQQPAVLAISDPIPPASGPTAYNVQQLYRLLDRRYRAMKSTWVSLNALTPDDADAKLSAPVFDRLRENAEMFRCFWPSWREKQVSTGVTGNGPNADRAKTPSKNQQN